MDRLEAPVLARVDMLGRVDDDRLASYLKAADVYIGPATGGESFGHVSVLDRGPRPATAKATERGCELLVIDRQHFMDLVTDRPELLHGLFKVLTKRVRHLLEQGDRVVA